MAGGITDHIWSWKELLMFKVGMSTIYQITTKNRVTLQEMLKYNKTSTIFNKYFCL